jgi:hypothetical protein
MGVTYHGPYAEAIGYDDHEGYAARILPDGTETAVWTYETREFRAYRTRCACGWRGSGRYPATGLVRYVVSTAASSTPPEHERPPRYPVQSARSSYVDSLAAIMAARI